MRITVLEIDIYIHSSLIHGFHMESQGISDKEEPLFFFFVLEKKVSGLSLFKFVSKWWKSL